MENAPFQIGQKVVRIGPSNEVVKKGSIYTVAKCVQCKCGTWFVALEETPSPKGMECIHKCGHNSGRIGYRCGVAKNFAPIVTQYEDCTSEIANDERYKMPVDAPDKILIPQESN